MTPQQTATSASQLDSRFRNIYGNGSGPAIRTDIAATRQLEMQVQEGVKAIRGHGVEIGGLIIGDPLDWSASEVVIAGFVSVGIEHRFGPAFRASELDVNTFREAAGSVSGPIIGYFRSHLRDEAVVREEDSRLLQQLFPNSDCCFALVTADKRRPSTVHLYKVPRGEAPVLFETFLLTENWRRIEVEEEADTQPNAPQDSTPLFARLQTAVGAGGEQDRKWKIWSFAGLAGTLALATASYLVGKRSAPILTPSPEALVTSVGSTRGDAGIGLNPVERGKQIEIRWSPGSPAIRTAVHGTLVIFEGVGSRRIDLDSAQLRSGSYVYEPLSDRTSFTFSLMIYQADDSFTGQVKKFAWTFRTPEPLTALPDLTLPASMKARGAKKGSPGEARTVLPPAASVPQEVRSSSQASPAQAPAWTPSPSFNEQALPLRELAPVAVMPVLPAATAPAAMAAHPPSDSASTQAQSPGLTYQTTASRLVAAQMVHQAVPAVPLGVGPRIRTQVEVDVRVAIDVDGKVNRASIVSSKGAAAGLLAIETLKAAQLCRFVPAQENGHPVPSSMVIKFRFAPRLNP